MVAVSDARLVTVAGVVLGALAVVASLSPEADRVVTILVLALLGAGVVAGAIAYRVHVLRIRRAIEARGTTILRRVDVPERRRPACRATSARLRRRRISGRRRRLRDRRPRPSAPG